MHMALPLADEIQRVLAGRQGCSTHEPSYTLEPDLKVTKCCYSVSSTVPKLASAARRPGSMICATTLTMTPSSFAAGLASRPPNHSRLSWQEGLESDFWRRGKARFLRLTFSFRRCRFARGMRENLLVNKEAWSDIMLCSCSCSCPSQVKHFCFWKNK